MLGPNGEFLNWDPHHVDPRFGHQLCNSHFARRLADKTPYGSLMLGVCLFSDETELDELCVVGFFTCSFFKLFPHDRQFD